MLALNLFDKGDSYPAIRRSIVSRSNGGRKRRVDPSERLGNSAIEGEPAMYNDDEGREHEQQGESKRSESSTSHEVDLPPSFFESADDVDQPAGGETSTAPSGGTTPVAEEPFDRKSQNTAGSATCLCQELPGTTARETAESWRNTHFEVPDRAGSHQSDPSHCGGVHRGDRHFSCDFYPSCNFPSNPGSADAPELRAPRE